jgi:hypothetical protein
LLAILEEKCGNIAYIDSDTSISDAEETLFAQPDSTRVDVIGGTISLRSALTYWPTLVGYMDVYLKDVGVEIKKIKEDNIGTITIGGVRVHVTGNLGSCAF